jgi:uracil-DNA glycosylase
VEHEPLPPFSAYSGSRAPKMLLVGEAWGASEEIARKPFVGQSGIELFRMLGEAMPDVEPGLHSEALRMTRYDLAWVKPREAWLEAAGIGMTNVLAFRPPDNKIEYLCGSKKDVGGEAYTHPPISQGKYLLPVYLSELPRLRFEVDSTRPNLVVCLGNTACWGLLQATNIGSIRGAVAKSEWGVKALPTYHPSGVLRNWSWRPIVVADLMKAWRESAYPEIHRPKRDILYNPTYEEVVQSIDMMIGRGWLTAWDTETAAGQIKCISFSQERGFALVIPFWDESRPDWNYWPSAAIEGDVWKQIARVFDSGIPMLAQNGMYDLQYIMRMGILPKTQAEDTMLLHHSLFPELQKSLGFLGSIYTGEASWKLMRRHRADTKKKDE